MLLDITLTIISIQYGIPWRTKNSFFSLSCRSWHVIFSALKLCKTMLKYVHEPPHDKTNKMACSPSEDSDQPGHLPSLLSVFAVRMKKAWVLSYPLSAQRRLWSAWEADQSLCWAHSHFVGFVMRWLILYFHLLSCNIWQFFIQHTVNFSILFLAFDMMPCANV